MERHISNEESETTNILQPLAHICVMTHTDEQNSARCGMSDTNLRTIPETLCSNTWFVTT